MVVEPDVMGCVSPVRRRPLRLPLEHPYWCCCACRTLDINNRVDLRGRAGFAADLRLLPICHGAIEVDKAVPRNLVQEA